MSGPSRLIAALVAIGAAWGITVPLAKIAVTAGHAPLGLVFWQMALGGLVLGPLVLIRGKRISLAPKHLVFYAFIAFVGTILPNSASYRAALHLPSGVMSIVISLVPILAFPVAIALATDRFQWRRFAGLALGFAAMLVIALPETSLPERGMAVWLPLAMVAPAFYALEGNLVAKFGTFGLDPVQVLAGASILGAVITLPATLATGTFVDPRLPWEAAQWAIVAGALAHAMAYTGYVWIVGQAGAVFASQVSYLVTGFGIFWAWAMLSEGYSAWVWGALGLMFAGLFLVQPRSNRQARA